MVGSILQGSKVRPARASMLMLSISLKAISLGSILRRGAWEALKICSAISFRDGERPNKGKLSCLLWRFPSTKLSMVLQRYLVIIIQNIEYNRESVCGTCNGSRAKPGTTPTNCNSCNGTGVKSIKQGMMVMQTVCDGCQGQGQKIK